MHPLMPLKIPYPGLPLSMTRTSTEVNTTGNNPKSSTETFGDASANRLMVLIHGVGIATTNVRTITAVTIGGVTATEIIPSFRHISGGNQFNAAMWAAIVPTTTSGTVSVTLNNGGLSLAYQLISIPGIASATPHDTDSFENTESRPFDLSVPYGGIGLVFTGGSGDSGNVWSLDDTSFTTIHTENVVGTSTHGVFSVSKQGVYTPSAVSSGSPTYGCAMAASWARA